MFNLGNIAQQPALDVYELKRPPANIMKDEPTGEALRSQPDA